MVEKMKMMTNVTSTMATDPQNTWRACSGVRHVTVTVTEGVLPLLFLLLQLLAQGLL